MEQVQAIVPRKEIGKRYVIAHPASLRVGRVLQCFLNTDMRMGHDGLRKLAKDNKINVDDLQPGQYLVFINNAKDKLKIYASFGVIAYQRMEKGRKLDLNVIPYIPKAFNGTGRLDYEQSLKEVLEKALEKRLKQPV